MRMPFREHNHHGLIYQRVERNPFAVDDRRSDECDVDDRRSDECDVDLAAMQRSNQSRSVALLWREDDTGKALPVGPDDAEDKPLKIGRAGETQMNVSRLPARTALHPDLGPLHLVEDPARFIEQQCPRLGELHATRLATEKRG